MSNHAASNLGTTNLALMIIPCIQSFTAEEKAIPPFTLALYTVTKTQKAPMQLRLSAVVVEHHFASIILRRNVTFPAVNLYTYTPLAKPAE